MRLILTGFLASAALLLGCHQSGNSGADSQILGAASPTFAYVHAPSDHFQVGYAFQRIYVVSTGAAITARLVVNKAFMALTATAPSSDFKTSLASGTLELHTGDKIYVAAKIGDNAEEILSLDASPDGGGTLQIAAIQATTLPVSQLFAGNDVNEQDFLVAFNQWRGQHGLSTVQLSHQLTADSARNDELQQQNGLGHYYMGTALAQNAAWNYPTIASVISGWESSPGHYANMIGPWTCMGIHQSGPYWTQSFNDNKSCD